ncbi:MAG: BrnT family toxin [Elusimicrobia bacterium]|nr:BrnT family toxin [Elusimicrobiota bacterium]MDE2312917.1 BrnT family toxin [Elusimicrobiota bacterium]
MDLEFGNFIWDSEKEKINVAKHGIDFFAAAEVFADPGRKIFIDSGHGARDSGERGHAIMRMKTHDEMPHGRLRRINDALPPPEELVLPKDDIKVTLALSRRSVDFFKEQARRHQSKYQRMIRELVDLYALRHSSPV